MRRHDDIRKALKQKYKYEYFPEYEICTRTPDAPTRLRIKYFHFENVLRNLYAMALL